MSGEKTPRDEEITSDSLVNSEINNGDISQTSSKYIKMARKILNEIDADEDINDEFLLEKCNQIINLFYKNVTNHELFYVMIEGIVEISKFYKEDWDSSFLSNIIDKLLNFMNTYIDNINFITAISDAIIQVLEIVTHFELYDELEEYAIFIVNKSIDNPNNLILRTLAAEVTITTIKGFGDDWNYEKTKEFDIILKGLLPPSEINGFLAGILIKGLAVEINAYGDMHEFSSLKRTLRLMNELYLEQNDFDEEFLLHYSSGLVNAITWFGESEDYDEMMVALNNLSSVSLKYPDIIEIKITYANGLRIALDHCGIMED
ncbi:MAG: hypothetical protein FK733_10660, partial [Asgard group archaeon]|nr:hypothetical protein [Asgard group archaeon]